MFSLIMVFVDGFVETVFKKGKSIADELEAIGEDDRDEIMDWLGVKGRKFLDWFYRLFSKSPNSF